MKHLALTLIITLVSSISLATGGGGGGGGWRPGPLAMTTKPNLELFANGGANSGNGGGGDRPTEIVFNMGQKNGLVKFAYGQLVDKKWQIDQLSLSESDLSLDPATIEALNQSLKARQWVPLK